MREARWFPVDLDVQARCFAFMSLDDEVVERSNFLDTRIEARLSDSQPVALDLIPSLPVGRVGWLFHTSFCGSTLAARALHVPPHSVCLREPLVLRRLADARRQGLALQGVLEPAVSLLARPWHTGGAVVIKPTHAALNLAADLLAATPGSRGVVLTSSLRDFLISNLKKPPQSQARIPELAERALRIGGFASRLRPEAMQPPDLLCAAALQWAAQREAVVDLMAIDAGQRVRAVDMTWLLDDLANAMKCCATWLGIAMPAEDLQARCESLSQRNAKDLGVAYDASRRASEAEFVAKHFGPALTGAIAWAERWLLPMMREQARIEPPRWSPA